MHGYGSDNIKYVRPTTWGEFRGYNNEDTWVFLDSPTEKIGLGVARPAVPQRVLGVQAYGYNGVEKLL